MTRPPRSRRLRVESLEHREVPATLTTGVDNDNYQPDRPTDWNGTDDLLSFREAIRKVNRGYDSVIDFNGLTVHGTSLTLIPDITRSVTVHGGTLDRGRLSLRAGGTVRDMTIIRTNGLAVSGRGSSLVENNFIGTDANGTPGLGNTAGLSFWGTGGTVRNNVIAGNDRYGVMFGGHSNRFVGNKVGVAPDGITVLPNDGIGIRIGARSGEWDDGPVSPQVGNVIGGPTEADRNIIVGFTEAGILLAHGAQETDIGGNYIGLTADGKVPAGRSNGHGILLEGHLSTGYNFIGGPGGWANWIVGVDTGIWLDQRYNTVAGNVIGLQANGTAPAAADRNEFGVWDRTGDNVIGMPIGGYRNIISGNAGHGLILNSYSGSKVQNNWIGFDLAGKAGTAAAPRTGNGGAGIAVLGSGRNNIGGGSTAARNVIAGNDGPGVLFETGYSVENRLRNNVIGLDAAGALVPLTGGDRGNRGGGVVLAAGANNNSIGEAGAGNVISGNTGAGVRLVGMSVTEGFIPTKNSILANRIGTDRTGTQAVGNGVGILVEAPASENFVGDGTGTGRNLISGNLGAGVETNGGDGTVIRNNWIGTDKAGTGPLGNGGDGIHIVTGNATTAVKNKIAFNAGFGIRVDAGNENTFDANAVLQNGGAGIALAAGTNAGIGEPAITQATRSSMTTKILGVAATRSNATLRVQLFGSPTARDDGQGEGARYLAAVKVTTDATGAFTAKFGVTVPAGFRVLTITVTDEDGNTSEFSGPATT